MKRALLAVALIAVAATMMWAVTPGAYNLKPVSCNGGSTNCTLNPIGSSGAVFLYYTGGGQIAIGSGWSYFPSNTIAYQEEGISCPPNYTGQCTQVTIPAFSTPLYGDCLYYSCHNPTGQTLTGGDPTNGTPAGTYETDSYYCGGFGKCLKPISGVITVTVR